jgi:hypothetical protein
VLLFKGGDMEKKSKPQIYSVYYHLKWCIEGEKLKNNKEGVTITLDNICIAKS